MINLKLEIDKVLDFVNWEEIKGFQSEIDRHYQAILNKTGTGNDFLGWVDLPSRTDENLINTIEETARNIAENSEIHVVIGIGGSYLGARAVIEALQHSFSEFLKKEDRKAPYVIFAGNNISEDYLADLLEVLNDKDYSLTVISKSGTTTEPAIAFRILRNHLEDKYGKEEAKNRIIAITDKSKGALRKLADDEGYQSYNVPDDVGGRYSVLTPVGLVPIAIAGFDIRKLIGGAVEMQQHLASTPEINKNPAALYAAIRNAIYRKGKPIEVMVNYIPSLFYFTEWWKQLYGESEGKDHKGIFPAGVNNTTDLHSMGQYIQDGLRLLFETVLTVDETRKNLKIPKDKDNLDGLNYLAGKKIQHVNKMAEEGTMLAHIDGEVPNIRIIIPRLTEETLGQLIYFYEMACAISGYILEVNPFNQPGVEAYKKNMFALLGKPGFEKQTESLKKRLGIQ